jgi:PAS domain S-box-containing protein
MKVTRDPIDLLEAFHDVSDGVFAVDEHMRILFWNWPATRIFGVSATTALGRQCHEVIQGYESSGAPLCSAKCRVMGCAQQGRAVDSHDLVRTDQAGNRQWLNVTIVVLRGTRPGSTLAVHLVRDVTEQRIAEGRAEPALTGSGI